MVLARAVAAPRGLSRTVLRRVGSTSRSRAWRQVNRRGYASGHGHGEQQSSEIPWIIGSLAVTVPAAGYLWQQGSKSGGHGHGEHGEDGEHDEHDKEEGGDQEEQEQPQEEGSEDKETKEEESDEGSKDQEKEPKADEAKDEEKDKDKDKDKDQDKGDSEQGDDNEGGEDKSDDSEQKQSGSQVKMSEDGYELPSPDAPQQINWSSSSPKGPGEGQKGTRKPSEKKGEKDSASDFSGAKHPYLDDPEKSKKGVGVTDTAKIHGTVDPKAPARGVKNSGTSDS